MSDSHVIGDGIRRLRRRRNLTLADLAGDAGLTPSALSQIERGVTDPSVGTLRRLARALEVPVFQFFLETDRRDIVVRRPERRRVRFGEGYPDYFLVSADMSGDFEVIATTIGPGDADGDVPTGHSSEECIVVLRGRVQVEVAGRVYQLAAGDSIKIHRELPHRIVGIGRRPAELLMVLSPPMY
jgi:transcriptional regulator with XRE-family HTH domain